MQFRSDAVLLTMVSKRSDRVRLRPTGRLGRALRLGMSTLLVVPTSVLICVEAPGLPVLVRGAAGMIVLLYVWLWLRFSWVGMWTSADALFVRSWWRSLTISREEVARFAVAPYVGFFFVVGWPVVSGTFQTGSVNFTSETGTVVSLGGTLTSYRQARLQAEILNNWLGIDVGSGRGPRRRRNDAGVPVVDQVEGYGCGGPARDPLRPSSTDG